MSGLLPVDEALARILADVDAVPAERVPLAQAHGRTLAEDVVALRTQPPVAVSSMDGYALRMADAAGPLTLVGQSAAGKGFGAALKAGETVRIFTGAPVPMGCDAILIQENAVADGATVRATVPPTAGRFIRRAGLDFEEGEVLLHAGRRLGPAELALAAAMNHPTLPVRRKPVVAIIATGDELVLPGRPVGPDQIVASNAYAIAAFVEAAGGVALDLGIVPDRLEPLEAAIQAARAAPADVLVTLGGASVGDHDLVKPALAREGMRLGFWRIAMRPGKPLIHGRLGPMTILGLPGNPVSSIVCGTLFLVPLVRALNGDPAAGRDTSEPAVLGADLPANDERRDYLRASLETRADGATVAVPNRTQDSSMLRVLAQAQGLLVREAGAPPAKAGEPCRVLRLDRR